MIWWISFRAIKIILATNIFWLIYGTTLFLGYWETVNIQSFTPPGSASHGVVTWKDSMFVIAGESYNRAYFMYVYDFNGKKDSKWKYISTDLYSDILFNVIFIIYLLKLLQVMSGRLNTYQEAHHPDTGIRLSSMVIKFSCTVAFLAIEDPHRNFGLSMLVLKLGRRLPLKAYHAIKIHFCVDR